MNDLFFIKYWDETGLVSIMKSESTGEYWAKLNDGSGRCSLYGPFDTLELVEIDLSKSNILDVYMKKPVLDTKNSYRVYPNPTSELDDHWFNCKCGNMQRIRAQSSDIAKDKVNKRGWTWTKIECEQQKEIWRCPVCSGNLKDDDDIKTNSIVDNSNQETRIYKGFLFKCTMVGCTNEEEIDTTVKSDAINSLEFRGWYYDTRYGAWVCPDCAKKEVRRTGILLGEFEVCCAMRNCMSCNTLDSISYMSAAIKFKQRGWVCIDGLWFCPTCAEVMPKIDDDIDLDMIIEPERCLQGDK